MREYRKFADGEFKVDLGKVEEEKHSVLIHLSDGASCIVRTIRTPQGIKIELEGDDPKRCRDLIFKDSIAGLI